MTDRTEGAALRRAVSWAASQQWAIQRPALDQLLQIAAREHIPDFQAVAARQGDSLARGLTAQVRGDVAVIEITGPIFRYSNLFSQISGATSIEIAALELQAAIDDQRIRSIVLNIDSPGGAVTGVSDFAKAVHAAPKNVVAFVGGSAASAAYWIAAAARWVVCSDTAMLGSIGVVSTIVVDEDARVVDVVSAQSPNKRPDPRTDEGRAVVQRVVDELASVFVSSVASYRGTTPAKVVSDFGGGSVIVGNSAVAAGLADEVGTLEGVLASFARSPNGPQYEAVLRMKASREAAASPAQQQKGGSWERAIASFTAGSPNTRRTR